MHCQMCIYIWDPLLQYEDSFSCFPFSCPQHKNVILVPRQWTDGSTNTLNPRVILDNIGPRLLITRTYYFNSGESRHYVRGTDGELMDRIAEISHLNRPFKLIHKYAVKISFVKRLRDSVSNGISFNHFQASYIAGLCRKEGTFFPAQNPMGRDSYTRTKLLDK